MSTLKHSVTRTRMNVAVLSLFYFCSQWGCGFHWHSCCILRLRGSNLFSRDDTKVSGESAKCMPRCNTLPDYLPLYPVSGGRDAAGERTSQCVITAQPANVAMGLSSPARRCQSLNQIGQPLASGWSEPPCTHSALGHIVRVYTQGWWPT